MSSFEHRKLRHARIKEILFEASQLEPHARCAFLDRACVGDRELREELESLLSFLDGRPEDGGGMVPSDSGAATLLSKAPSDSVGLKGKRKRSR